MTNKEKYKQAFSGLQASGLNELEVRKMAMAKKKHITKIVAAAAAISVLLLGGTGTAYAMNVGGIQRTVQLWLNGDQTSATLELNSDGSYDIYLTGDKENSVMSGGGVAYEWNGKERPLTEEELMEEVQVQLNAPEVEYEEDGTVWVYYHDQKIEITDRFDDEGICYVKLVDGNDVSYLTVKYDNGYAWSEDKYADPQSFN